jgi:Transposase zinc-ribbon domain
MPIAGEDYPRNWVQFLDWFHSEDACRAFLDHLRWPVGFICPKCEQAGNPCRSTRGRIMCLKCQFQTTVTVGAIFDKTRTEVRVWFAAIWYITNQKHGISAHHLGDGNHQSPKGKEVDESLGG